MNLTEQQLCASGNFSMTGEAECVRSGLFFKGRTHRVLKILDLGEEGRSEM